MFGKNKFDTPVVVFRQSPDGFTKVNTAAVFIIKNGSRRLRLRSGIIIGTESTSKVGNTYFTFTPDEKVYFPVKINLLPPDVVQRIEKYENEHIEQFKEIDQTESLDVNEKEQKKKELLLQALNPDERKLLEKYGMSFDILPDQAAYEILQQQIEEANRIKMQKKKTMLEILMPVLMIVGLAIGYAILAYATANYNSAISGSASTIATASQNIVNSLHSVLTSLGTGSHTAINSTIPPP